MSEAHEVLALVGMVILGLVAIVAVTRPRPCKHDEQERERTPRPCKPDSEELPPSLPLRR